MAGDAFEETLAGFRRWAGTTDRRLNGDPEEDAAELDTVFGLMPDYLGIDAPSGLTAGSLAELLLDVYPRKVTVLDPADVASTIPALRDLTSYLADTAAITAGTARAMDNALDEIEPDFAGAMMDPSRWGPATAIMHAMKEDFGIPDVVAPVRLPGDEELAALAAAAPLLADLRGLARDVREATVPAAVDPLLLALALECGLAERNGDALVPGDDAERLDDLADGAAALDAWDYVFGQVLDTTLEAAGETGPRAGEDLDLTGHGLAARLRASGVHVPDLPPPGEMTADDVVLLSMSGTEEDFAADFASWVAQRTTEDAARELLTFAASEGAAVRMAAVRVVSRLDDAAEPALRDALGRPELRCHAKMALSQRLAERSGDQQLPAELQGTIEDIAWVITDSFASLPAIVGRNDTIPFDTSQLSTAGLDVSNESLFEAMARLDHPDAEAVLTMIGQHGNDKKTAKAARKAAFKAASRRASRTS